MVFKKMHVTLLTICAALFCKIFSINSPVYSLALGLRSSRPSFSFFWRGIVISITSACSSFASGSTQREIFKVTVDPTS